VIPEDSRLPAKERVLAVISESESKVYSIEHFDQDKVIVDLLDSSELLIFGSKESNFILAYENIGLQNVQMTSGSSEFLAEDSDGNKISLSGAIVEGPLQGTQLVQAKSILGYYFSLAAFYPDIAIYQ